MNKGYYTRRERSQHDTYWIEDCHKLGIKPSDVVCIKYIGKKIMAINGNTVVACNYLLDFFDEIDEFKAMLLEKIDLQKDL